MTWTLENRFAENEAAAQSRNDDFAVGFWTGLQNFDEFLDTLSQYSSREVHDQLPEMSLPDQSQFGHQRQTERSEGSSGGWKHLYRDSIGDGHIFLNTLALLERTQSASTEIESWKTAQERGGSTEVAEPPPVKAVSAQESFFGSLASLVYTAAEASKTSADSGDTWFGVPPAIYQETQKQTVLSEKIAPDTANSTYRAWQDSWFGTQQVEKTGIVNQENTTSIATSGKAVTENTYSAQNSWFSFSNDKPVVSYSEAGTLPETGTERETDKSLIAAMTSAIIASSDYTTTQSGYEKITYASPSTDDVIRNGTQEWTLNIFTGAKIDSKEQDLYGTAPMPRAAGSGDAGIIADAMANVTNLPYESTIKPQAAAQESWFSYSNVKPVVSYSEAGTLTETGTERETDKSLIAAMTSAIIASSDYRTSQSGYDKITYASPSTDDVKRDGTQEWALNVFTGTKIDPKEQDLYGTAPMPRAAGSGDAGIIADAMANVTNLPYESTIKPQAAAQESWFSYSNVKPVVSSSEAGTLTETGTERETDKSLIAAMTSAIIASSDYRTSQSGYEKITYASPSTDDVIRNGTQELALNVFTGAKLDPKDQSLYGTAPTVLEPDRMNTIDSAFIKPDPLQYASPVDAVRSEPVKYDMQPVKYDTLPVELRRVEPVRAESFTEPARVESVRYEYTAGQVMPLEPVRVVGAQPSVPQAVHQVPDLTQTPTAAYQAASAVDRIVPDNTLKSFAPLPETVVQRTPDIAPSATSATIRSGWGALSQPQYAAGFVPQPGEPVASTAYSHQNAISKMLLRTSTAVMSFDPSAVSQTGALPADRSGQLLLSGASGRVIDISSLSGGRQSTGDRAIQISIAAGGNSSDGPLIGRSPLNAGISIDRIIDRTASHMIGGEREVSSRQFTVKGQLPGWVTQRYAPIDGQPGYVANTNPATRGNAFDVRPGLNNIPEVLTTGGAIKSSINRSEDYSGISEFEKERRRRKKYIIRHFKRRRKKSDCYELPGTELVVGAMIIAAAGVRRAERNENNERTSDADSQNLMKNAVLMRRTHVVMPDDNLVDLAERLYGDANIGWLIADLNRMSIKESTVDDRRIVELRPGQVIDLPDYREIDEFQQSHAGECLADRLVTIVSENHLNAYVLDMALGALMNSGAEPLQAAI